MTEENIASKDSTTKENSDALEELDLTIPEVDSENAPEKALPIQKDISERPYDPDASRDGTRQTITLWLIGLLCAIVGMTFAALFARGAATGFSDKEFFHELKQVLDVLVAPIITLLASAVGFYFGYKQGEQNKKDRV